MKTETVIRICTLIGLILLVGGVTFLFTAYFSYQEGKCISDPVSYANNNSDNYWWDSVTPINIRQFD